MMRENAQIEGDVLALCDQEAAERAPIVHGRACMSTSLALDGFDLRLLLALQEDGRLTNGELAERVALSPSQCSRRRLRLEEAGIIQGYRVVIPPARVGLDVLVFVQVTLATHSADNAKRFAELVGGLPCVLEAHSMTGDADYLLKLVVGSLPELARVINDRLMPHESVAHVRSAIVLETLKSDGALPLGA